MLFAGGKWRRSSHTTIATGRARMVDVSAKAASKREADASAFVALKPAVLKALPKNPKGDPLEVARLAGIMAAKRTSDLIPMCHPLPLSHVDVTMRLCENGVAITSKVITTAVTGVEMEALVAASVAALTVYDMCKALDKGIEIREIVLERKSGGKSGDYTRRSARRLSPVMPNNVKVLLVDDNPMVLGLLQRRPDSAGQRHHLQRHRRRPAESGGRSARSAGQRLPHARHGRPPVGRAAAQPSQDRGHCRDPAGQQGRHLARSFPARNRWMISSKSHFS